MKVLVISDIHLKPWIIETADQMMEKHEFGNAVFLGDFADDWDQERNIDLYKKTYAALEKFLVKYPESKVCYGNHDLSYVWQRLESGYSTYARQTVVDSLHKLYKTVNVSCFQYIHKIGNVLFSHAGITMSFLRMHFVTFRRSEISWSQSMGWARTIYGMMHPQSGRDQRIDLDFTEDSLRKMKITYRWWGIHRLSGRNTVRKTGS